jgi:hypothetical protein
MKSGTFEYFGDGNWLKLPASQFGETNPPRARIRGHGLLHRSNRGLMGHGGRGSFRRLLSGWFGLSPRAGTASRERAQPEGERFSDLTAAWVALFDDKLLRSSETRVAALRRHFYC